LGIINNLTAILLRFRRGKTHEMKYFFIVSNARLLGCIGRRAGKHRGIVRHESGPRNCRFG
jgi:hypothetical protein